MAIPKRMSFFWGGGPLSWMRYMTFFSFRLLHPDWSMHLFLAPTCKNKCEWTTGEVQDCMGVIQSDHLADLAALGVMIEPWNPPSDFANASPVHMADLCRWGALLKFGGWFADTDILWIDSLERVLSDSSPPEFDVAMPICFDWLPTGLIGATPEDKFIGEMYFAARGYMDPRQYRSAGAGVIGRVCGFDATMPKRQLVIKAIATRFPGMKFWSMPKSSIYSWEWYDAARIFHQDEPALDSALAIHWHGGSRAGQKFNRLYTATNFRNHPVNTFTHFAADLIDGKGGE